MVASRCLAPSQGRSASHTVNSIRDAGPHHQGVRRFPRSHRPEQRLCRCPSVAWCARPGNNFRYPDHVVIVAEDPGPVDGVEWENMAKPKNRSQDWDILPGVCSQEEECGEGSGSVGGRCWRQSSDPFKIAMLGFLLSFSYLAKMMSFLNFLASQPQRCY